MTVESDTLRTFATICFVAAFVIFLSAGIIALYKWIKAVHIKHIICDIKDIIFGDRYFIKVNKVWSVYRGKRRTNSEILFVKYGPDKHLWKLRPNDWDMVNDNLSDEMIEIEVVNRNIRELKNLHPKKKSNIEDNDWTYEPRYYGRVDVSIID